jgi:hypothetical protein
VMHVALGGVLEGDPLLGCEDLDLPNLAAQRCLGLLAGAPVARSRRPDRSELALDLPVADAPLPVPRTTFGNDRARTMPASPGARRSSAHPRSTHAKRALARVL